MNEVSEEQQKDQTTGDVPTTPGVTNAEQPEVSPAPQPLATSKPSTSPAQLTGWQFHNEDDSLNDPAAVSSLGGEDVAWTASEFIAHEKSAGWYFGLSAVTIAICVLEFFITGRDLVLSVITLLMAIIIGVSAGRKPRVQEYALSGGVIRIGQRIYPYQEFKSFSVDEDGAVVGIVFIPLKRFMPSLTIYLAPDIEDKAVQILSERLPMEVHKQDTIDKLLKRVRY